MYNTAVYTYTENVKITSNLPLRVSRENEEKKIETI